MTLKPHIIVQAGGRGSRLRHHTWNKPKCLVSIEGKPILYHLFERFPDSDFSIIVDYLAEQLRGYLEVNPVPNKVSIINPRGKGTASGISLATKNIDESSEIILTWSDLIFGEPITLQCNNDVVIATTNDFACRWSVSSDSTLIEAPASKFGVAGLFKFPNKSYLAKVPATGEFVKWLSKSNLPISFQEQRNMKELGEFKTIESANEKSGFTRFFNNIDISVNTVTKTVKDENYRDIHNNEKAWYEAASKLKFRRTPKVLEKSPLVLERIIGKHAYEFTDLSDREKGSIIADFIDTLGSLHDKKETHASSNGARIVYIDKTKQRVLSVSKLIPNFDKPEITINGKKCRNIFSKPYNHLFDEIFNCLIPSTYCPIHGDPTFSNSIIDKNLRVWLIDPRGYFSKPGIMGDPFYDYAKVYYSAVGNYDLFNRRKFKLFLDQQTVEIILDQSAFRDKAEDIFKETFGEDFQRIKLLHGLIWLSLSGYVKDDVDSIIGAFFNGLFWLEEGMSS